MLQQVSSVWKNLPIASEGSYFLSWGWVKNWLISLPRDIGLWLAVLYEEDVPVCAFFLSGRNIVRHNLIKSRSLFLNTTGIPLFDKIYIEYNSVLMYPRVEAPLRKTLEQVDFDWEEFQMPAMDADAFPILVQGIDSNRIIIDDIQPSFYVDLSCVASSPAGYLSLLSSNTRSQVRRSYRTCAKYGDVELEAAGDLATARDIFEELVGLHQATWQARGQSGAFATDYFREFHKRLISDRFEKREIQLLRVSAGEETIGCLYNFVYKQKVLFYQSGFNYQLNSRLKPGLLSHTEAITYNTALGNSEYDFLAGNAQYKKSLSTGQRKLIWARIQKSCVKFKLESLLKMMTKHFK